MSTDSRDDIIELFDYHHWAADRVLEAVSKLSAAQLDRPSGGSFGTGRALLRHVVGVEYLWCERWNGRSPKGVPEYAATFSGRDFQAQWSKVKAEQAAFISGLTRDMLLGQLTYVNTKGEKNTYRLSEVLFHVANHGTYHRGQITHLLRDLGVAAPSTDFLIFVAARRED